MLPPLPQPVIQAAEQVYAEEMADQRELLEAFELSLTQQFNEQTTMIRTTGDPRAYAEQRSLVTSLERLYEDAAWSTRVGDAIRST